MSEHALRISAIIPVYNGAAYLGMAIDSILAQTLPPEEIIVVDDGSTDGSAGVAAAYGAAVRYHSQPNAGIGAARNEGVALATGDLLAFLDADDLWMPDKLALQVAVLRADAAIDLVFGAMQEFCDASLDEVQRARLRRQMDDPAPGYFAGSMLVRRAAFDRVGLFAPDLRVGEFLDWYQRAKWMGLKVVMLPDLVLRRRIHAANTTRTQEDTAAEYLRVVRAGVVRKRQVAGSGWQVAGGGEQMAGSRGQGADGGEQGASDKWQGAGSREQGEGGAEGAGDAVGEEGRA